MDEIRLRLTASFETGAHLNSPRPICFSQRQALVRQMALASTTIRATTKAGLPTDSLMDRSLQVGGVAFSLWATPCFRLPPCPLAGSPAPPGRFPGAPWRIPPRSLLMRDGVLLCLRCRLPARRSGGAAVVLGVSFAAAACAFRPPPGHDRVSRRASPSIATRRRGGAVLSLSVPPRRYREPIGRCHLSRCCCPALPATQGALPLRLELPSPPTPGPACH